MKKDYLCDNSDWELSLVKLTGKKIKDITGYVTNEFGDPTFKLCSEVLEDGKTLFAEGEHDLPYLCDLDEKILEEIWKEENKEE